MAKPGIAATDTKARKGKVAIPSPRRSPHPNSRLTLAQRGRPCGHGPNHPCSCNEGRCCGKCGKN